MPFDEILNEKTDDTVTASAVPVFNSNNDFCEEKALAMAYVPFQKWEDVFDMEEALKRGTLFAQLYKPYIGGIRPR